VRPWMSLRPNRYPHRKARWLRKHLGMTGQICYPAMRGPCNYSSGTLFGNGSRRDHLDVERHLPPFREAHFRRGIAAARTLQHKTVEAGIHHLVAFLHIDGETTDIGHEYPRTSGNI